MVLKMRLTHSSPVRPLGRSKIERPFRTINNMFPSGIPGHLLRGKPLSAPMSR